MLESSYDPNTLEPICQDAWRQSQAFIPRAAAAGVKNTFVYACTPFTTGKAHMGHVRSYTIADVCARRARSQGDSVLWSMGFDAFGLPNEITAIENSIAPREWVANCADRMRKQFDALGLSVDWSRCFVTSEPDYYRWTQWVFLRFLEQGLIYKARGIENWCDNCKTVLATLQVSSDERCWRCERPVTLAAVEQWYLRFLPYASKLEDGLSQLEGWDNAIIASQRALLGKSQGAEFDVAWPSAQPLKVFTPYPSDIAAGAFIALSPNHSHVALLGSDTQLNSKLDAQRRRALSREDRGDDKIPVIATDLELSVPGLQQKLPVVITVAVDMKFGGGAVLGIPSRDQSDALLAKQLNLQPFDPSLNYPAIDLHPATRYRLRDSSISRQRTWGAPVPIIHCPECGVVPVPDKDLPVLLPADLVPNGQGAALATHPTFSDCVCPRCASPAKRDTDTLDVHVDSIWMLVPFCVPTMARDEQMFTHPELRRWLPVSQVVCGIDQAGWWINDRLFFKVMKDCGYFQDIPEQEPVREILMHEMVLSSGRKMSKSLGNVVDPEEVIRRFGADAVRLSVLRVSAHKAFSWTEEALEENYEFLSAIWAFINNLFSRSNYPDTPETDTKGQSARRRLERWCFAAETKVNRAYEARAFHIVLKELKNLFAMIKKFVVRRNDAFNVADMAGIKIATELFLNLLEPLAPHISYTLSKAIKQQEDVITNRVVPGSDSKPELVTPQAA